MNRLTASASVQSVSSWRAHPRWHDHEPVVSNLRLRGLTEIKARPRCAWRSFPRRRPMAASKSRIPNARLERGPSRSRFSRERDSQTRCGACNAWVLHRQEKSQGTSRGGRKACRGASLFLQSKSRTMRQRTMRLSRPSCPASADHQDATSCTASAYAQCTHTHGRQSQNARARTQVQRARERPIRGFVQQELLEQVGGTDQVLGGDLQLR